jgi:hypothetical protein
VKTLGVLPCCTETFPNAHKHDLKGDGFRLAGTLGLMNFIEPPVMMGLAKSHSACYEAK